MILLSNTVINWSLTATIACAFLISLFITGLIIPKILLIAYRKNLFDEPDERKIHKGLIPRLGGIAFVPSVLLSVSMLVGLSQVPEIGGFLPEIDSSFARSLSFGFCGMMVLFLVGIADDLIGVLYRAKFVAQIISALFLICGGLWINNLHGFCGIYEWPDICGCLLTILVAVFFVNAINLIDGIDGLASGLSAVALAFYGIFFAVIGQIYNAMIAFATFGTLAQFFYYNVFGNPVMGKKIFMGDTGALCIGFILTYLSVSICRIDAFSFTQLNPIVVAFAPMLVPCLDVLRVFFNRIRLGNSPFKPDRTHIHHKLLRLGMSTPRAMVSILLISVGFVIFNVLLSPYINPAILIALDLVLWVGYNRYLSKRIRKHEKQ